MPRFSALALVGVAVLAAAGCAGTKADQLAVLRAQALPPPPAGWTTTYAWEQSARCSGGDCRPAIREQTWACACDDPGASSDGVEDWFVRDGNVVVDRARDGRSRAVLLQGERDAVTVWVKVLADASSGPGVGPPGSEQVSGSTLAALAGGATVVIRLSDQRDW